MPHTIYISHSACLTAGVAFRRRWNRSMASLDMPSRRIEQPFHSSPKSSRDAVRMMSYRGPFVFSLVYA